jgi:hypothetical protein
MKTSSALICCLVVILLFAPLPPGLALNDTTGECGDYRGGDEFATYKLPEEWKVYYAVEGVIRTDAGSCSLEESTQECCRKLGYRYIPGNVGEVRGSYRWSFYSFLILFINVLPWCTAAVASAGMVYFIVRRVNARKNG